jgi:hypothetical protein
MNATFLRTRQISLALLVTAVVEQQHHASADVCGSSKLLRLGHDLLYKAHRKRPLPRHR